MAGWGRVVVRGSSMLPALADGDRCVVRWGSRPATGDVVVARRPDRPDLVVVKRATARESDGGWWLEGDHERASHDSWVFGPVPDAEVLGRVVWRYRPLTRFGMVR